MRAWITAGDPKREPARRRRLGGAFLPARAAILVALLAGGCGVSLDVYSDVEDLRVLAIQAEPPEVQVDVAGLFGGAVAPAPVRFRALVVDPRRGELAYTWSFCPVESGQACYDYEERLDGSLANIDAAAEAGFPVVHRGGEYRALLDALRTDPIVSGTALPLDEVEPVAAEHWWSERGVWPHAVADYTLALPPELFAFHFDDSKLGLGTGAWPSAILEVEGGEQAVRAAKRVVIAPADLRGLIEIALGVHVCPEGEAPTAPEPECLQVENYPPNTNPVFEAVLAAHSELATAEFDVELPIADTGDVAGVLEVKPGEAVRILPKMTAASSEPYQLFRADLETLELEAQQLTEEISISWFTSHGRIQDQLTWPLFTKTLDTVYTAPAIPPAETGGRATVWMIARDQRGGIAWMAVELLVVP